MTARSLFAPLGCLLAAASLPACSAADDDATLEINSLSDGTVGISLNRMDSDHTFGKLHATANGIALDAPTVMPGHDGGIGFDANSYGPTATFVIPAASLGDSALDVTVTEDDESFHALAPEFFAPRTFALRTTLDHPLHPGDMVEGASGVASDELEGQFTIANAAGTECTTSDQTSPTPDGGLDMQLSTKLVDPGFWFCDTVTAGTLVNAQMAFELWVQPAVTCDGPSNLTCDVQNNVILESTSAVQVQL